MAKIFYDNTAINEGLEVKKKFNSVRVRLFSGGTRIIFLDADVARELSAYLLDLAKELEDEQNGE